MKKRAELSGEIERAKQHLSVQHKSLTHIDGALSLFGYEFAPEIESTYKRHPGYFVQGELVRFIFDRLREGPHSIIQLRNAALADKGVSPDNTRVVIVFHKKMLRTLKRQEERGSVTTSDGKVWALTHSLQTVSERKI